MRSLLLLYFFGFPHHDDYSMVCLALIKNYQFLEDKEQFGRRNCGCMVGIYYSDVLSNNEVFFFMQLKMNGLYKLSSFSTVTMTSENGR